MYIDIDINYILYKTANLCSCLFLLIRLICVGTRLINKTILRLKAFKNK